MEEKLEENIEFTLQVVVSVSAQAQKVIKSSKYTIKEFIDWIKNSKQVIPVGGNNATLFLEEQYNRGD